MNSLKPVHKMFYIIYIVFMKNKENIKIVFILAKRKKSLVNILGVYRVL